MALNKKIIVTNRKMLHEYNILEKYEAGIVINGSEVKSLRESKASLQDSFCKIDDNEAFIYNLHIAPYEKSTTWASYEPKRKRKLLLHKREIYRLFGKMTQRGLALVPSEMYFNKPGIVKMTICLAKKRSGPDKRELIKKKDLDRELRSYK
jgi:SsrA-binding protein